MPVAGNLSDFQIVAQGNSSCRRICQEQTLLEEVRQRPYQKYQQEQEQWGAEQKRRQVAPLTDREDR